jgi:hypothetical protein
MLADFTFFVADLERFRRKAIGATLLKAVLTIYRKHTIKKPIIAQKLSLPVKGREGGYPSQANIMPSGAFQSSTFVVNRMRQRARESDWMSFSERRHEDS